MMNGFEFLPLAQDLSKRAEPAAHRSAISRAYYAAYNGLLQYLLIRGIPKADLGLTGSRKGDSHVALEMVFRNVGRHDVANDLKVLRMNRLDADYLERKAADQDVHALIYDTLVLAERLHEVVSEDFDVARAWQEYQQRLVPQV